MGQPSTQKVTSTQTRNVAPPSQNESLLEALNVKTGQAQAQALQDAINAQNAYEHSAGYQAMQGIGGQAAGGLSALMANGMMPSGPQQDALQRYYQQSIIAPALQQMQQTAAQEAARRGMTIADSPIGNPYLQNMANYQAQIGGQQAGSALQLGQNLGNTYQNALNFGQQLQQNTMQNRNALINAQPGSYGLQNQMAQNRIAASPVTQSQTTRGSQPFLQSFGQFGQGIGGLGQGLNGMNNFLTGGGRNDKTGLGGVTGLFGLGG